MKRKIRKRLTEEQQAIILANYQKYTLCEIAEKMNVQYHQVNRFAKKNNLSFKRCRVDGGSKELTQSEEKVVKLLCKGWSNQKIADSLCLSITTIKTHLNNIYQKYHLYNLTSEYSTLRLLCAFKYLGIKTDV